MKSKVVLNALALLFAAGAMAQDCTFFFPQTKGTQLVKKGYDAKGNLQSVMTYTVDEVKNIPSGLEVEADYVFKNSAGTVYDKGDLEAFCKDEYFPEFLPEYQNLEELEDHYRRGGLGDVKVKKFLNNVMQAELSPIRARRKEWEQRIPDVMDILREGSRVAEAKAAETLNDVKASMRINYFDSDQSDMYQK